MYLIITRTFPPDVGGMQNLMWGLARSLSKLDMVKVFADYHEDHKKFDDKSFIFYLLIIISIFYYILILLIIYMIRRKKFLI